MAVTGARGVAIATIANGKVASEKTFGDRNEGKAPLVRHAVIYCGTLTKAVVGYLTVQLDAEGRRGHEVTA